MPTLPRITKPGNALPAPKLHIAISTLRGGEGPPLCVEPFRSKGFHMARFFYLVVLVILVGAIGIFAYQNSEAVNVHFLQWERPATLAAVAGAGYLLGMLSGWSVIGIFRRSLNRVTEIRDNPH
jgi:uncharacterized integral membrane protein